MGGWAAAGVPTVCGVSEQPVDTPRAVWVRFPRFSAEDDVQAGWLHAWARDAEDTHWRARVTSGRETAPGFAGAPFDGWVPETRVRPRAL